MDEQTRGMMHQSAAAAGMLLPQHYGAMGAVDPGAVTTNTNDAANDGVRKQDINTILEQIMNITDQSLDEAQAR